VYAQTPGNSLVGVTLSVLLAATTSFLVASVILRASRRRDEEGDLAAATAQMEGLKGKESSIASMLTRVEADEAQSRTEPIRKIVFACDAGMGSSAMGASVLRNKLKKAGFEDVSVVNVAIANLDDTYDVVVTHQDLTLRAMDKTPTAQHVSVQNFMNSPKYDVIVDKVRHTNTPEGSSAP
jgi:PTS system mannitol-specific IIC component